MVAQIHLMKETVQNTHTSESFEEKVSECDTSHFQGNRSEWGKSSPFKETTDNAGPSSPFKVNLSAKEARAHHFK
jgi:hypothetical protein